MIITGTHFNYYHLCHRKLWLFANGIQMEHTSELVDEGRLVHETSYIQRSERFKEVEIEGIKIDFFDHKNRVIHEIKKSSKLHKAHVWQLKYYIYILEKNGVDKVSGLLAYPKERKTEEVWLSDADRILIQEQVEDIRMILNSEICPGTIDQPYCKKCSYFDFCYADELNDTE